MITLKSYFTIFVFILFSVSVLFAQLSPEEVLIPMRDGESLAGDLYLPDNSGTFPTILIQTPYNKAASRLTGLPLGIGYDISQSNYAFLVVDWRCYFGSASACKLGSSNSEDGYDVVEWIEGQVWSDGNVGTWGPSALGSAQFQTAREQPEALKCAVPIVVSPQVYYEKYFEGGSARVDYINFVGTYFGFQGLLTANPYYNFIWEITENTSLYSDEIAIPMLIIGGWFDHNSEDCIFIFEELRTKSEESVRDKHCLIMGPWSHNFVGNKNQGSLEYPDAENYHDMLANDFFDYYLRGLENGWEATSSILYYQMGEDQWKNTVNWPPNNNEIITYSLGDENKLSPESSQEDESVFTFEYDPEDPSPSHGGKIFGLDLLQLTVGPQDISDIVEGRNDNVIFTTDQLTSSIKVKGKIEAEIYVSSDRVDTDLALRISDVYPDGRSIILGESYLRLHMRNGFRRTDASYLEDGEVYKVNMDFDNLAHTFLPGHKIRLVITSSNYPRFNRNMNTGEEMYPNNNLDTLVNPLVAINSIHLGGMYPSKLLLPVDETSVSTNDLISSDISFYPNPVSNRINISNIEGWKKIEIIDVLGRKVESYSNFGMRSDFNVPLSNLKSGTYFIQIQFEKQKNKTIKIIKI